MRSLSPRSLDSQPASAVVDVQPGGWEVLTESVVPLVGAIGSIVVAVVAVWVTQRLARVERRERARSSRIEYAQSSIDH